MKIKIPLVKATDIWDCGLEANYKCPHCKSKVDRAYFPSYIKKILVHCPECNKKMNVVIRKCAFIKKTW